MISGEARPLGNGRGLGEGPLSTKVNRRLRRSSQRERGYYMIIKYNDSNNNIKV